MYMGNKINGIVKNWRLSGDIQVRLSNDLQALDQWYVEFIASYMVSPNWEIIPDFRFTTRPDRLENRLGFSVIRKDHILSSPKIKHQFINQVKYQLDFNSSRFETGVRYLFGYNMLVNKKLIPSFAVGAFYRWSDTFDGVQFIRGGPGLGFVIDEIHTFNVAYYFGVKDLGSQKVYQGIISLQLVFNINRNYKYIPARYEM